MKKVIWQDGLFDVIEKLCETFPSLIRQRWSNRLILNSERIAAYEEANTVNDDIFWRSVYEVFPADH